MATGELVSGISYSLLAIIVNRGKGSKLLESAREAGASDASCVLGKGIVENKILQMIEVGEVDKEIIFIVVPSAREAEILSQLNTRFHFERQNHGIAFTMPLAGALKIKSDITTRWRSSDLISQAQYDYAALLVVVDKGKAENVIKISQDAGYNAGAAVKISGYSSRFSTVLNMIVEPEKEAVLMVMESELAKRLVVLLHKQLNLNQPNSEYVVSIGVSQTLGLPQNRR